MEINIFEPMPLVYAAQSKYFFFCRDAVCEFVLKEGAVPLHPFRIFDYFLGDRVDRDLIRRANNNIVSRADEVWVFGDVIANGVLFEIDLAYTAGRLVKFFTIATKASKIHSIATGQISFEQELIALANGDIAALKAVLVGDRRLHEVLN